MTVCEHADAERRDRGTATAEFAVVLPALVLLVVVLAGAAAIGFTQLRAFDAARSAAREIARGEPHAVVVDEAKKHAGRASTVRVGSDGGYATVTVTVRLPDAIFFLDEVEAAATARTEGGRPGGSDPG
ncbi:TadE family type IV pilus minor pilin [Brevibacterium casei]|uniref:Pilus assembly protein n=3 Tax=Bacteria TaxID=2 RepID=A0A449DCJ4_9MICO|nr:TadE family type IV pilus minor pilin [Brevibacterium casei]MCT1549468.1 pilus assembly protein [Brevibacterium casei]MCT1561347.1 pilus assembly protein [Brevibacterium casei]MCT2208529.1 pilus assembly protein [Brevibacterium casei]QPR39528.1 pilus assembly protein [Brevibacterium casei]QPR43693.1 pilus assembly protein [Brevibacterium casei]